MEKKKLVIVGAGEFAHIAYEYFVEDSLYQIAGFAVESQYVEENVDKETGLPIISFEDIVDIYPPSQYEVFVAVTYVKLNRERRRLYRECKRLGYACASYISKHSFVWKNAEVGENSFIFEDNTIQYHVKIGNNVILWSGNHIGHRSVIHDDCWLTSHVVVSGFCEIGSSCFIGVNATLGDHVKIADDVILGAGAVTVKDLGQKAGVYVGCPARLLNKSAYEQFHVEEAGI